MRLEPGVRRPRSDQVAGEEPLEIRLEAEFGPGRAERSTAPGRLARRKPEARSVAVTMRTPGQDFELAAGFLFGEGILADPGQVREITYCRTEAPQHYNVVSVRLREGVHIDPSLFSRNFYTSSSCGVCGKASLEAVEVRGCAPLPGGSPAVEAPMLSLLPDQMRAEQPVFERTGGLHAAALFDPAGRLELLREDVGRHNAVDKVVGHAFLEGELPLGERILVVSGRVSFEIVQKAVAAGIPIVLAVGAPTSLAVDLARRFRVTLVGFARADGFNVYAGEDRVRNWPAPEG